MALGTAPDAIRSIAATQAKALTAFLQGSLTPDNPLHVWMAHPDALPGSGNYATAFTTFVLQAAGAWPDVSMNKRRPEGSMEALFMQDAATAFASMALLEATP